MVRGFVTARGPFHEAVDPWNLGFFFGSAYISNKANSEDIKTHDDFQQSYLYKSIIAFQLCLQSSSDQKCAFSPSESLTMMLGP